MAQKEYLSDIINLIAPTFVEAKEQGLEIEVMASTIQHLIENPGVDLSVALQHGLNDWDI